MTIDKSKLSPSLLIPPGVSLQEILNTKNMSQKELAIRTGLTTKHLNQIIKGNKSLTCSTAIKLENALGVPASFWNTLEANYSEERLKIQELKSITQKEFDCLNLIPHKELRKFGFIEEKVGSAFLIKELRNFFKINNLLNLSKLANQITFRKSIKVNRNFYSILAWTRMCEIEASKIEVKEYDVKRINSALSEIKNIIMLNDINIVIAKLTLIFSKYGIAFKVTRNLAGAPVQGMIRKLSKKVILGLTMNDKYADAFWFTLIHEIGHLLNSDFGDLFIDLDFSSRELNKKEKQADRFANNFFIPENKYNSFILKNDFSETGIIKFAKEENVLPGIVVGRLQREGKIQKNSHNGLRFKFS